jgi:hypothetical protein
MAQTNYRNAPTAIAPAPTDKRAWMRTWWFRLLALLMFIELIWPFILWQAGFKQRADFTKDIVAAVVVGVIFLFILVRDRLPAAVLLMVGITFIWGMVSMFEGQPLSATAWGWWRLFKYPLMVVFAYLIPRWPPDTARLIVRFLIVVLALEVGVQLLQLASGAPPGDSLAGTFGNKGVGAYTMFTFLAACIGMGHWLATGQWKVLFLMLALGLAGSMLSVTKFYVFAVALIGVVAVVFHLVRGGRFRHLFLYIFLFVLAGAVFVPVYNNFIATTRGLKPLQEYMTRGAIEGYLFKDDKATEDGQYKLGRGAAVTYAWQQIRRDWTTTLFGYGMGSRTYSDTLGLSGATLEDDLYGGGGNTSLGIWIQEYGLVGLLLFLGLNIWIMVKLFRHAGATADPYQAALAYGLMLFTFLWPVWLWYHKAWLFGVMMILYWVSIGFLFSQIYAARPRPTRQPLPPTTRDDTDLPFARAARRQP